jgi:hypothetical protein
MSWTARRRAQWAGAIPVLFSQHDLFRKRYRPGSRPGGLFRAHALSARDIECFGSSGKEPTERISRMRRSVQRCAADPGPFQTQSLGRSRVCSGPVTCCAAPGKRGLPCHHFPLLGIETQGSLGGSGLPFCRISMECLSGERTKAMLPSRGGRLMVTPPFISFSQTA